MGKQKKLSYRTTMPEILAPGTGLSPLTNKSIMPFNNVHTIWDVLTGDQYKLPGMQDSWGPGENDQPGSFKETGDDYKRRDRDLEILMNMSNNHDRQHEQWKLKVRGGWKTFPSLEAAQSYRRKMRDKGIQVSWISRVAQNNPKTFVDSSLDKTFTIESKNYIDNVIESGSAFCVAPNYLLTCAHVVMSYNKNNQDSLDFSKFKDMIEVTVNVEGRKVRAEIIDFDGKIDLALLRVDVNVEPFEFDPYISIGEEVFAVGSPHGFENNVSFGHVSSTDKKIYFYDGAPMYMFVDLSILPGNSGGPIVNENTGKVIGVVTAIVGENDNYGLNAGLPSTYAIDFCKRNNISI